jgi:hypothetical protein
MVPARRSAVEINGLHKSPLKYITGFFAQSTFHAIVDLP